MAFAPTFSAGNLFGKDSQPGSVTNPEPNPSDAKGDPDHDQDPDAIQSALTRNEGLEELRTNMKSPKDQRALAGPLVEAQGPSSVELGDLYTRLRSVIQGTQHHEMWGVDLEADDPPNPPTLIVLAKFLARRNNNVDLAEQDLRYALLWRYGSQPRDLRVKEHDRARFENLVFITEHLLEGANMSVVVWYLYGELRDMGGTFKDKTSVLDWWTSVMEIALDRRRIMAANIFPGSDAPDTYKIIHVHDFTGLSRRHRLAILKISAFKQAAIRLGSYYPNIVSHTYITGCTPSFSGWFKLLKFTASKPFLFEDAVVVPNRRDLAELLPPVVPRDSHRSSGAPTDGAPAYPPDAERVSNMPGRDTPIFSRYPHEFSRTPGGESVKAGTAPRLTPAIPNAPAGN